MQGQAEKKKEEKKQKQELSHPPMPKTSIAEGLLKESRKIESHGRASFEKGVKLELAAIEKMKKKKKGKKQKKGSKFQKYGYKQKDSDDKPEKD